MKKLFPIILASAILLFVGVYFFFFRNSKNEDIVVDDSDVSAMIDVAFADRPIAVIMPRADGRWLDLEITNLGAFDAARFDYQILYNVPDKPSQGTQGMVELDGKTEFEKEILLGTESSGNYYYDDGVETGSLSLKFRNDKGKLIAKFTTDFHIQSVTDELSTVDGDFTLILDKEYNAYFVTMETFGAPMGLSESDVGPFGVFSSSTKPLFAVESTANQMYTGGEWVSFDKIDLLESSHFSN